MLLLAGGLGGLQVGFVKSTSKGKLFSSEQTQSVAASCSSAPAEDSRGWPFSPAWATGLTGGSEGLVSLQWMFCCSSSPAAELSRELLPCEGAEWLCWEEIPAGQGSDTLQCHTSLSVLMGPWNTKGPWKVPLSQRATPSTPGTAEPLGFGWKQRCPQGSAPGLPDL